MPKIRRAPWIGREKGQPHFYIYWYVDGTRRVKRRSCGTCDRNEAEKELGRFLIERAYDEKNTTPILTPDKYLIATALRWYAQERGPELASKEFLGRAVERLIKFFGPNATVSNVTPQVTKRYCSERVRTRRTFTNKNGERIKDKINSDPVSNGTTKRELSILSAAFGHAVKNGRLTSAPKVIMPPDPPNKTRYLNEEEIQRLLENCVEPHLKLFVLLALNTGARKGALLELKWTQIDFSHRIINLNPEGRTQNNKRRAIVPVNDVLLQALNDQRAKLKEEHDKMIAAGQPLVMCPNVISYRNGPIVDIKHGFRLTVKRAGLSDVTPHTLRHTAGTLMALAGIDLFLIAKLLGHSVQKTTELYAHFHPDYLRGAVNVLNNATPKMRLYGGEVGQPGYQITEVAPNVAPNRGKGAPPNRMQPFDIIGAGDEDRTRDPDLGKDASFNPINKLVPTSSPEYSIFLTFSASSHYSVVEIGKKVGVNKRTIAPFTVRLTSEERTKLEQEAQGMPLGAYVRSRIFDASISQRKTRNKHPVKDRQALGRLLAELGNARLANNLNQLAKAIHTGSLPVSAETEAEIKEAYAGVLWMRQTLIAALSLHPGDNP